MKRIAVVVAALLLPLAACGDDEPGTAAGAAEPAGGGFPVEVEHVHGTTTVPEDPERIVVVGYTEQDVLLALGRAPVAVTEWYGDQPFATWPWARDELGDAEPEVLSAADGFQYERIAALDPDLIIGTNAGMDAEAYEKLSELAPTIAHAAGADPWFSEWDVQTRLIGQAIGRAEEAEALVAGIEDRFAEVAAEHPEFAGTSIVFLQNAFYEGSAIAYQEGLSTKFLTDLGFTIPSELDEFVREGGQAYVPLERLPVLDVADVLLWATEAPEDVTALEEEPLYRGLRAVRDGDLVFTDGVTAGAIYFTSPLSLPYLLDHLVPALADAVAGRGPATAAAA